MKGCQLEDPSADLLGEVLQKNNCLQYVNLADNFINDKGALKLLQSLGSNHTIKELVLRSNFVSYRILSVISRRLGENKLISAQEKVPRSRQRLQAMQGITQK
jgi:Ran GTPase-activating protein (RanGAP) involved in mRNA processing and transport